MTANHEIRSVSNFLCEWENSAKKILTRTPSTILIEPQSMVSQSVSVRSDEYSRLTDYTCGSEQIAEFYSATNGLKLFNGYGELGWRICQVEEVDYFSNTDPGAADDWIDGESVGPVYEVSDAEYFIYGTDQSSHSIRSEYLKTAISLSDLYLDSNLLINPAIVFENGEPEIWYFAAYLAGAFRFRCFYDYLLWERNRNLQSLSEVAG